MEIVASSFFNPMITSGPNEMIPVNRLNSHAMTCLCCLLTCLIMTACGKNSTTSEEAPNQAEKLAGVWKLKSRIIEGHVTPADIRQLRFEFKENATFEAFYRYDDSMEWTKAGQGALMYEPPVLVMYWEDGREVRLIVLERTDKILRVHHGRNLVPLEDQIPQELFVTEKTSKTAS